MIDELLRKFPLITTQVSHEEIAIILREFIKILDAKIPGDIVEFGCYKGTTSLFLARVLAKTNCDKKLFLYDSFVGLPEKTCEDLSSIGQEFRAGELATTKADLLRTFAKNNLPRPIVTKKWFRDLTDADLPHNICFAFFDGDFYESIRDSFIKCQNHFAAGATIVVDDFANEHLPGAALTVNEWRAKNVAKIANFREEKSLGIIHLK